MGQDIAHVNERESLDDLVATAYEAYLKLAGQSPSKWRDRAHFFAVASLAMRHVLVDFAKARVMLRHVLES